MGWNPQLEIGLVKYEVLNFPPDNSSFGTSLGSFVTLDLDLDHCSVRQPYP